MRGFFFCFLIIFFYVLNASAQIQTPFEITSPPSPVGSGARAMGVGGAFIAVADDATAASWNPGALIQLELPEATIVGTYDARKVGENDVDFYDYNYVSISYPFTLRETNMIISFNYQKVYDFYARVKQDEFATRYHDLTTEVLIQGDTAGGVPWVFSYQETTDRSKGILSMDQIGKISTLGPAFAIQITPKLSVGFSYNFWGNDYYIYQDRGFEQKYHQEGEVFNRKVTALWVDWDGDCICHGMPGDCVEGYDTPQNPECLDELFDTTNLGYPNPEVTEITGYYDFRSKQKIKLSGENFNLGFLWDVNGRWTIGGVYRRGFTARADREVHFEWQQQLPGQELQEQDDTIKYREKLTFPSSYGIGVGYRYSDALSFTADLTKVQWNEFYYEYEDGTKLSPVDGLIKEKADIASTFTFRAGAEYLFIEPKYVIPVRAGFFYDEQPARGGPDVFRGVTIGTGFAYKWLVLDLTYFYRWGDNVVISTTVSGDHKELKAEEIGDIDQHMVMLSTIFHFK